MTKESRSPSGGFSSSLFLLHCLCIHLFIYLFIHVLLSDTLAMSPSASLSLLVIQPPSSWKTHRAPPSHPPMASFLHSQALKYNMLRQECWHREPSENCRACIKETHKKYLGAFIWNDVHWKQPRGPLCVYDRSTHLRVVWSQNCRFVISLLSSHMQENCCFPIADEDNVQVHWHQMTPQSSF